MDCRPPSAAGLQTELRGGTDGSGREPRVLLSWKTANEDPLEGGKAKSGERGHKVYKKAESGIIGWKGFQGSKQD